MSTYVIKWLKDKLGTRFFPVTHINAVRDDMGTSLASMLEAKQDTLVSGTNIKTVNNNSLVGSGNVSIATGDTNVIETVKVNNTALTPDASKAVNISAVTSFNGSTGAVTYTAPVTSVNGETGAVTLSIPSEVTESTISGWGFTKNVGTITGITMNGASKGTSGVVNLGTVITAHQDISGKADKSTTTTAGTYKSVTVNSSGIVTGGSNPTTIAGYGITDAYTKTETDGIVDDYLPLSGGTLTGGILMSQTGTGYGLVDSLGTNYVGLCDNGENLWIGSTGTNGIHHTGATYISAGTGNVNISRLVNGSRLNYMVLDNGNYSSYALPLSGGTMTGNLYLQNNVHIYSYASNGASKNIFGINSLNNLTIGWDIRALYNTYLCGKNIYFNASGDTRMFINSSGNVGIGTTSPTEKLHVNGVVKCTSVDTSSDERIKNKVGDINIKVEDIAAAPNVTFTWKKGEDTENIHGGTFAQYWEKITPYYVHGDEEKSMDYASLSLSCAIELAKEVVQLKEENAQLKREITKIKEMLKMML